MKAEVDWGGEIGALARITLGLGGPALLFENIKDHQDTQCTKFVTASMGNKSLTMEKLSKILPEV